MDQPWLFVIGVAVVLLSLYDLLATTLAVGAGRGPIGETVARASRGIGHLGRPTHARLRVVGVAAAALVPSLWVGLLWLGFALMFLSDAQAVLDSASQQPASVLGRIAFAAGGLAGAGAGLLAGTEVWQLANNVAAIVGLAVVTLGLTYLFQVVTHVTTDRAMASRIAGRGRSPSEAVATALRRDDLRTFPSQLTDIADRLSLAAQGHLALPLLRFFHTGDRDTSVALNLARYEEMLTLLEHAVGRELDETVRPCREAVDRFLASIRLVEEVDRPPPLPPLAPLREVSDAIPDDRQFAQRLSEHADRRTQLWAYVREELWSWDDVAG